MAVIKEPILDLPVICFLVIFHSRSDISIFIDDQSDIEICLRKLQSKQIFYFHVLVSGRLILFNALAVVLQGFLRILNLQV